MLGFTVDETQKVARVAAITGATYMAGVSAVKGINKGGKFLWNRRSKVTNWFKSKPDGTKADEEQGPFDASKMADAALRSMLVEANRELRAREAAQASAAKLEVEAGLADEVDAEIIEEIPKARK